ncbi:hypothetical protein Tco_0285277 [Tanacetum coccineum]
MQAARDRQKSYANLKHKPMEFQVRDKVMLKVSPWKGVVRFWQMGEVKPRNCYADESLAVSLDGLHFDDKLQFVEEPVQIVDREAKRLKRSRIPLIKSEPEADPEEDDDEDPEEDPVDYSADGGDDKDDEDEPSKEDKDDDVDMEANGDEEKEEHLAPADSVVVALPATDQAPSAEETEPFETDESAAIPPPHLAYRVTARISIPALVPTPL